ncbi:MAG: argininosuccinate synthase [Candidatus Omnitrophica bacterium]|nr:argininosuccinate synthase [Candidatus Omnitrophota bacterium]
MKIVLAYSGGLDTSIIIKWLKDKYNAEIIAFTVDIGQKDDPKLLEEKAYKAGASKFYFKDMKEEFINEFVFPSLRASALYENKYPLATALSRPLIAKGMVDIAKKENADAFAHGCTGKGNDQVRFEFSFKYLAPEIKIIAPVREWEFKSREEEIEYAKKHNIPVPVTKKSPYSIDWNLWGISIECGILENPEKEPPEDAYQITKSPQKAPSKPEYIEIEFDKGAPVGLNGKKYSPVKLIKTLTEIAGKNGIGRIDMIENRFVGIKSREIYEAPAATVLHIAHNELECLTMERDLYHFKNTLSQKYAEIVYYGYWFTQFRESLDDFVDKTQQFVSGKITLKLFKGNCTVAKRTSPYSLYDTRLSTYTKEDIFDHKASKGFLSIAGLPLYLEGKRKKL